MADMIREKFRFCSVQIHTLSVMAYSHENRTETETHRDRDQNNGNQSLSSFRCSLKASTQYQTTHLFLAMHLGKFREALNLGV